MVDYSTVGLLAYFIVGYAIGYALGLLIPDKAVNIAKFIDNPIISGIILAVLWLPIEAFLLSTNGNTLGKWIFGISVRTTSGEMLSFNQALKRSWGVLLKGLALGIPFVLIFTQYFAYRRLTKTGTTLWDTETNCVVIHKTWTTARAIACVCTIIFILLMLLLIRDTQKIKDPYEPAFKDPWAGKEAPKIEAPIAIPAPDVAKEHASAEIAPISPEKGASVVEKPHYADIYEALMDSKYVNDKQFKDFVDKYGNQLPGIGYAINDQGAITRFVERPQQQKMSVNQMYALSAMINARAQKKLAEAAK